MARLPALIDAIAACDPRGRATVEHVARVIREAGLIQTTKRGRGAAEMTEHDAVALLVGLNGSESLLDAPAAVERFKELVAQPGSPEGIHLGPELMGVAKSKRFLPALETLLLAVPVLEQMREVSDQLYRSEWGRGSRGDHPPTTAFGLAISFHIPEPAASISIEWGERIQGHPMARDMKLRYRLPKQSQRADRQSRFDRTVIVSIGMLTLANIHEALWPGDDRHREK